MYDSTTTGDWWDWNGWQYVYRYLYQPLTIGVPLGTYVDAEKYDLIDGKLVPRKSYQEKLLKDKEEELKTLEANFEKDKKRIEGERETLLKFRENEKPC